MFRLVGLVLLLCIQHTSSTVTSDQQCSSSNNAGIDPNTGTHTEGPDNNLAFNYVAETHNYDFECCGVVTTWRVITRAAGTLQFQVWRRMSTTDYRLIGENYCAITSTEITTTTCSVTAEDQIVVQKGDFIGWHNEGAEMVMYTSMDFTDHSLNNLFRRKNVGDLSPGASEDWSEVESYNDRNYGIRATYVAMTGPVITASSASVTVPDTMFSGGHIANIYYSDVDSMDNSSLTVIEDKKSVQITTTIASGYVAAANSYRLRDVVLKYTVMDTCWFTATATVSVTVQPTLVTIDSLDATFTVSEAITAQTYLYTLTATDPVDQWYCYSTWTASSAFPFLLKALTTTTYGIYVTEHPSFNYDSTPSYLTLGVTCLENRVASTATVSENIRVYLTRNQPPVLTNLDASVTVNANTVFVGDTVYTVSATDPDGDIVTYAMTCTPAATTYLTLMKNGQVQVKDWLLTSGPNYYYDCSVTVTDSDSNTDVGNLQISISNVDDQVEILNMPPARIELQENTPLGTSVYRFRYDDRDTDAKTWSITTHDTVTFSRFFNLDPDTGTLTTAFSLINREGLSSDFDHVLSISVGDVQSSDTENLDITIINENEAPYFTRDNFHLEVDEAADGTTVSAGTFFTFVDEDVAIPSHGEEHTFELDCDTSTETQRFSIDTNTGDLTYEGPMDLDYVGTTPTDYACIITVRDKFGLSDTANLFIHVKNVNEFTPQFTSIAYTIYVSSNTLVGTQLLVVTAVDYDRNSEDELDSDITYTLDQAAFGSTYFAIKEDGSIYLAGALPTASMGTTLGVLLAQASNYNEAGRTGSTSVTIVIPGSTTTVPVTTDRNMEFYEDELNYFWLLLTLLGVTMVIVAIILVSFRLCRLTRIGVWCKVWCMKGICCRPKPEGPRGFGDMGYDLAKFGHRHRYADEDDAVDGWLRRTRRTHDKANAFSDIPSSPTPLLVDSQGRFGTPLSNYDNSLDVNNTPIYEMFRVPSPGRAVTGDEALDPLTSTRRKPIYVETWKDRKKQPILKPTSSKRWGP